MNPISHSSFLRMAPLLRSIAREIKERTRAILELEARLASLGGARRAHREEAVAFESQLSAHRRELHAVEKELGRLGWTRDEQHPYRLLMRTSSGLALAWRPEETGFFRRAADSAV
jgi:hypothetical protein